MEFLNVVLKMENWVENTSVEQVDENVAERHQIISTASGILFHLVGGGEVNIAAHLVGKFLLEVVSVFVLVQGRTTEVY